jgi:hypothetical protein
MSNQIHLNKIDYKDEFSINIENNNLSIQEVYIKLFSSAPKGVEFLMKLRNKIVGVFGLKTEMKRNENPNFKVGDKVGIFKIYEISENEIIAGEDDKLLDFRVSVLREVLDETTITVLTTVQYNNWFGKLYFIIVKPFHKVVVKSLIKSAAKRFEK